MPNYNPLQLINSVFAIVIMCFFMPQGLIRIWFNNTLKQIKPLFYSFSIAILFLFFLMLWNIFIYKKHAYYHKQKE